jgi:glycosyltransferase involved in cell wall biosynthesis
MRACDVVVAHGSSTLPATVVAGAGLDRPIVYRSIGDTRAWTGSWRRRARVGFLLRRTATVVALWDEAASALCARYALPVGRVRAIPNAVAADRFRPPTETERTEARKRFGLAGCEQVVVYVGALSPEKHPALAVRSVAALPSTVGLVIAGEGPERGELAQLAADLAPERTVLAGPIDDVTAAYWAGDALILPSCTEGMPAAPIEAGLCGVATVATRVGAVGEIVLDGRTGGLFSPGDADAAATRLGDVLRVPQAYGSAARQHCRAHFDLDTVADAWTALLREIAHPR